MSTTEIKPYQTLQILNFVGFFTKIVVNRSIQKANMPRLKEITADRNMRIFPAGWAFAIWGIIYLLMATFAVYQALPSSWVPERNDQLIFEDIGYVFITNVVLNMCWFSIFKANTSTGFLASTFIIIGMLSTAVIMMMKTSRAESLNSCEYISMMIGFSIYAGWLTAATILNICYYLKSIGYQEPKIDEEKVTIILLWIATLIYVTGTIREKNPWYGLV